MDSVGSWLWGLVIVLVGSFLQNWFAPPESLKGAGTRWLWPKAVACGEWCVRRFRAIEARRKEVEEARLSLVATQNGVVDLTPYESPEQGPARSRSRLKAAAALDDFAAGLGRRSAFDDLISGLGERSALDDFAAGRASSRVLDDLVAGLGSSRVLDDFAAGRASSRVLDDFTAAAAFHEKFEEAQRQARWHEDLMGRMTEIRDNAKRIESYACRSV